MTIESKEPVTLFEINSPIWNGDVNKRVVGLAKHRLTKHNEIHFMYRRKKDGQLSIPDIYYFDGETSGKYKTQTIHGTEIVLVPFDDLIVYYKAFIPDNKLKVGQTIKIEVKGSYQPPESIANRLFEVETVEFTKKSRRANNALKWLAKQGYTTVIGGMANLSDFIMCNNATKEIEHFNIKSVIAEYDQERKDEARARAAERRLEKSGSTLDVTGFVR